MLGNKQALQMHAAFDDSRPGAGKLRGALGEGLGGAGLPATGRWAMTDNEVSFRDLGFLVAFPGKEYRLRESSSEIGRGQALLQIVAIRVLSDEVIEAATERGLSLKPSFDYAHPDFALLEVLGLKAAVDGLAGDLKAAGYRDLDTARLFMLQQKPYDLTRGGEGLDALPDFMTEKEVAKYLRKASVRSSVSAIWVGCHSSRYDRG